MIEVNDTKALKETFGESVLEEVEFRGEQTVVVESGKLLETLKYCKEDLGYDFLIDISSLDHESEREKRFEMVYELTTVNDSKHLRIRSAVDEDEEVPSAIDLWLSADWHEREAYDMMGIKFSGHPDMRRILMWEGFPYFPLRKDFPLAGKESEMPDVAFSGVAPLEGGPFVTGCGGAEPRAKGES